MRIERGQTRIALIGERFTIKLPRIRGRALFSELKFAINLSRSSEAIVPILRDFWPHIYMISLAGFGANITEWWASRQTRDIIAPTRFSFFGIFNIQTTAKPLGFISFSHNDLMLIEKCLPDIPEVAEHTVFGADNYGIHDGKYKLLDAGGLSFTKILIENQKALREALDTIQNLRAQSPQN